MTNDNKESEPEFSIKKSVLYSFAGFTDVILFQFFTFLIFTFYYSVVELHVGLISIAFIIWSIWNAINDPLLGSISDRTSTKWGRRKPFIIAGIIPLLFINVLLWTPPRASKVGSFIYLLIIIIIWELFYTMYSLNQTSLFPEMFRDLDQRAKANNSIQLFQVISLIIAFLLPGLFIPQFDDPQYFNEYSIAAIVISIICAISVSVFIKFGLKERIEFSKDPEEAPPFFKSLKYTFKNKAFRYYLIGNFALWYWFNMIPTILPLYGDVVLDIQESEILSLILGTAFISAAIFVFLWRIIVNKFGAKNAYIMALIVFIITSTPLMFISELIGGFIAFFFIGFGLAGALTVRDVAIAAIIDEDEINSGIRREGAFYGINGFIVKFSNVAVFISIALVFIGADWAIFDPSTITGATEFGLRSLMSLLPMIFLIIAILSMSYFPINKEKYDRLTDEARELHSKKKEKVIIT